MYQIPSFGIRPKPDFAGYRRPETDSGMHGIFSILIFCHNFVTTYKYKFACMLLRITTYANTEVVFIQFTQVSNDSYFLFFSHTFDLLFTTLNFAKMAAATLRNK